MARLQLTLAERLWRRVQVGGPDECWLWQGCLDTKGYGALRYQGKLLSVHRVALEVSGRPCPPPPYHHALHNERCKSRACCNPRHLRWGSNAENVADRVRFGRRNVGERHGSAKLTAPQVISIRASALPADELAAKLGVAAVTVAQARSGRTWKHLP